MTMKLTQGHQELSNLIGSYIILHINVYANLQSNLILKQVLPKVILEEPRHKVPIGYNGTPQIHPQNCPSTITTPSNTSIPRPTPLIIPTTSGSTQPFCHNTLYGQTDRPTDQQTDKLPDGPSHKPLTLA